MPEQNLQAKQLARAKAEGAIIVLPQLGQARIETMLEIIRFVEANAAGSRCFSKL